MSDTPNLRLPLLSGEQAQKHVTANEALRALDALVQLSVLARDLADPPGAPEDGDRYIVAGGASGAWSGHADEIAVRQGSAWLFHAPREGWRCWVEDEDVVRIFNGSAWVDIGSAIFELQNLALLGIGTTADAANPLAAKLNNILFTARTSAEGGDGDLRFKLNKEALGDTVSQLYQRGFSGRAETGLLGDDDFAVKVSPDGSAWATALVIGRDDGSVTIGPAGNLLVVDQGNAAVLLGIAVPKGNILNTSGSLLGSPPATQIYGTTTPASSLAMIAESAAGSAGNFYFMKGRAAGAIVNSGDTLGSFLFGGSDGANYVQAAAFRAEVDGAPGTNDMPGRLMFLTTADGSNSPAERLRIDRDGTISHRANAQVIFDANSHLRLRSYTIATLPAASPAGQVVFCSDLGGGGGEVVSDGSAWRRTNLTGVAEVSTNADFTLTTLTSAPTIRHTGTLTTDRSVTLSAAGAYNGSRFTIARSGGGIGLLVVGGLKSMTGGQWCTVEYDGSAWRLVGFGTL